MPGELDAELGEAAKELIDELGKVITMDVTTGGSYDASTRKHTGGSTTQFTANISPPAPIDSGYFDEDVMKTASTMVFMARLGSVFTPLENQVWNIESTLRMTVVKVLPFYSGNLIAVWAVALKT